MKRNKNVIIMMGILLVVLFNSVVYGALNTDMFIDGEAYVRVDRNIRITGIKVVEQSNGAYETYNSDYSKDTTSLQVTLPNSDSSITYEVTIINKGDVDYEVSKIMEESYSNSNIKYEIIDLEDGTVIDGETTYTFKIKLTTTENNPDNRGTLVLKYTFEEWISTLYNVVAHKSRSLDTNLDFSVAPTKEMSGVYKMDSTKNDEYPVYYYRGIVDYNNVSFAGFCWKAVRTTSTGGVKLIYNGVPAGDGSCNNTGTASQIGNSQFNSSKSNKDDGSYVYDNGNDSVIKGVIDKWYFENMVDYTGMLEDTVWCNDRSVKRVDSDAIRYGQFFGESRVTSVLCPRPEDSFTVNESNGNGKLTYPIALLTDFEVKLVSNGANYNYGYLSNGNYWWLMTPNHFNTTNSTLVPNIVKSNSSFTNITIASSIGVRPSISLVSGTMISEGNGSVSKPYKLVEDKIQTEWTFDYTGKEQELNVSYGGTYKLEVWGASGGNANGVYIGGYGAYATGNIQLARGNVLYINIGGSGSSPTNSSVVGGYNGGGDSGKADIDSIGIGSGGGATHIATKSGLLSTLENNINQIFIVASGGGGGAYPYYASYNYYQAIGGSGGGIVGNASTGISGHSSSDYWGPCVGGTQELQIGVIYGGEGHTYPASLGLFGKGGKYAVPTGSSASFSGGGGGYYGGAGCRNFGGGGGSSYIGNLSLSNKVMYCYNCTESNEESTKTVSTTNVSESPISNYAKKGNGYAKITLIEKK